MSSGVPVENPLPVLLLFFFFLRGLAFFFLIYICFYLFIYGCVGASLLCEGPLQLQQARATPHRGARASHHRGLSLRRAQAPEAQAQQLWLTGPLLRGMWDPPRPGLQPLCPALAGRLSTTAPTGKSHCQFFSKSGLEGFLLLPQHPAETLSPHLLCSCYPQLALLSFLVCLTLKTVSSLKAGTMAFCH